jgi:hypothetical protein
VSVPHTLSQPPPRSQEEKKREKKKEKKKDQSDYFGIWQTQPVNKPIWQEAAYPIQAFRV